MNASNKIVDKNKNDKDDKLQKALDEIRSKYGNNMIVYADMMKKDK